MSNSRMIVLMVVLIVAAAFVGAFLISEKVKSSTEGAQVIHFNGQTLDLSDASNVLVQSSNEQRVFDADQKGGVVTVTTSIVTVTIWMRP